MLRPSELLFAILAESAGRVSEKQFLAAVRAWGKGGGERSMAWHLRDAGEFDEVREAYVRADVEEREKSGGPPEVDAGLKRTLEGLALPEPVGAWVRGLPVRTGTGGFRTSPDDERYRLGPEIGRGGLGRIVEAKDADLQRDVAIKLLIESRASESLDRFVREVRLTAALEHPNIVPVHDIGFLSSPLGRPNLFLCMKRIHGRTLQDTVRSMASGDPGASLSRARLLAIFQQVCLGAAFAHARGVLHRDLKPSNVMLGDFGEVLIVDWGLAKVVGEPEESKPGGRKALSVPAAESTTLEGEVMGTPGYMSPEQARGQVGDLDARTDIYSLGAILYFILAWESPFSGVHGSVLLDAMRAGSIEPPGARVARRRAERVAPDDPASEAWVPEPVPAGLEAICLKAMAHRPRDRHASALDLHKDVQLYLEGVTERERNQRLAGEAVARAEKAMEGVKRLEDEVCEAERAAREAEDRVQPLDDKAALWEVQDRAKALARAAIDAWSDANAELTRALGHDPGHAEARRLKAELSWQRFQEAEESGDEKGMGIHREVVERLNDGSFDARLRGDGTLTVRTRAYTCRCLEDGRLVAPGEPGVLGYHPFSGRVLAGLAGSEGTPEFETREPVRLAVHGPTCVPQESIGADVWLFRFEESGRRLVPVTPQWKGPAAGPAPGSAAAIEATWDAGSPYRPVGPGVWLGRTPIESLPIPMGSYLLLVARDNRVPLRVPVSVPRCGEWTQNVTLFAPSEIPDGLIPVPAGPFGWGGDREPIPSVAETRDLGDYFLSKLPVTCREYAEFLTALAATDPAAASRHVPRESQESGFYWPNPPYEGDSWKRGARRLLESSADWSEDWPVVSISWEDAMAFAAWKRSRAGRPYSLPEEAQWEKAARGPDRRIFPWGPTWDARWTNAYFSHRGGPRPSDVRSFPGDESPYGFLGMGGNCREVCLNVRAIEIPGFRIFRGGYWGAVASHCRATFRTGVPARAPLDYEGIRLACAVAYGDESAKAGTRFGRTRFIRGV